MSKTSPCDQQRILDFIDGSMPADDEYDFEQHVESCESCRDRLTNECVETSWWNDARQFLSDDDLDQNSISSLTSSGDVQPQRSVSERYVLDSLAPSDDPRMLGRIGGYEVSGVVGTGGMGVVLKAFDAALNRFVAIKVLAPHLAESAAARRRFAREAQAAAAVVHENVIAIHGVAEANGLPYLVMPYERSSSLQKRLDDAGILTLPEILRIAMQTAAGLAAAHQQGLVHRDIKPANLLLADGVERVAITDFGLARAVDDASLTRTGTIAGTPQFMSPEQAAGDPIDFRSDLFSLGSVIYTMCTGRPPFRSETSLGVLRKIAESKPTSIQQLNPDIPKWLETIVARLHEKSPDKRYQTAEEVSQLLEDCLAHVQQPCSVALPVELVKPNIAGSTIKWIIGPLAAGLLGWFLFGTTDFGIRVGPERVEKEADGTANHARQTRDEESAAGKINEPVGIDSLQGEMPLEIDWRDPLDLELEILVLTNEQLERAITAPLDSSE